MDYLIAFGVALVIVPLVFGALWLACRDEDEPFWPPRWFTRASRGRHAGRGRAADSGHTARHGVPVGALDAPTWSLPIVAVVPTPERRSLHPNWQANAATGTYTWSTL